ncbi:Interleukin enhancer-binding factor 3 [Varanus komodoensis]|nr:Interleukin enhancer-binding factor 3 [Varanus komodoensis]
MSPIIKVHKQCISSQPKFVITVDWLFFQKNALSHYELALLLMPSAIPSPSQNGEWVDQPSPAKCPPAVLNHILCNSLSLAMVVGAKKSCSPGHLESTGLREALLDLSLNFRGVLGKVSILYDKPSFLSLVLRGDICHLGCRVQEEFYFEQKATAEHLTRTLRGVMRVGLVAKGLLLKGDLDLELVLLCKEKPTIGLLEKVAENLGTQLAAITEDKYEIIQSISDAAIVIKNTKEPPLTLTIHLTSPVVREEMEKMLAGGVGSDCSAEFQNYLKALDKVTPFFLTFKHALGVVHMHVCNNLSTITITRPDDFLLSSKEAVHTIFKVILKCSKISVLCDVAIFHTCISYRAIDQSSGSLSCPLGNCLIPSPPDRTPLVKLYLVFLFHPRIETLSVNDSPDVLDRQKCLAALASLRHAKWFQVCILFLYLSLSRNLARANGLKSCVIVIRVLRDLCSRVPTWAPLRGWCLAEKLQERGQLKKP